MTAAFLKQEMDRRFRSLRREMNDRFLRVDGHFGRVDGQFGRFDERFARIDGRFDSMNEKLDMILDGQKRQYEHLLEVLGEHNDRLTDIERVLHM